MGTNLKDRCDLLYYEENSFAEVLKIKNGFESRLMVLSGFIDMLNPSKKDDLNTLRELQSSLALKQSYKDAKKNNCTELLIMILDKIDEKIISYAEEKRTAKSLSAMEEIKDDTSGLLSFMMADRGVSKKKISEVLGVTVVHVSSLLNGNKKISKDNAKKLGLFFKVDPNIFYRI